MTLVFACMLAFCWALYALRWWLGDEQMALVFGRSALAAVGSAALLALAVRMMRRRAKRVCGLRGKTGLLASAVPRNLHACSHRRSKDHPTLALPAKCR